MRKRTVRAWLAVACALFAVGVLQAGAEGDAKRETPSASHIVPLRLGAVDAISGNLSLRVPLGPRLPGRIPLGFTWAYEHQDTQLHNKGGNFKPVVWPGGSSSPLTTIVVVNGESWIFYKQAAPATGSMPTQAELQSLLPALGVDTGEAEADGLHTANSLVPTPIWNYTIYPSTDGTRFFIQSNWTIGTVGIHGEDKSDKVAGRLIVVNGANAIWTKLQLDLLHLTGVSYFTNRWNDKVSVTETGGGSGAPFNIVIKNELYTTHSITLSVSFTGTPFSFTGPGPGVYPGSISVANNLGLPAATFAFFDYQAAQRYTYVPPGSPSSPQPTGIYDAGVWPSSLVLTASDGTSAQTTFTWDTPVGSLPRFNQIQHPNGLIEHFDFDNNVTLLSNDAYDPITGYWQGYKVAELENCGNTCTFPLQVMNENGDGVCAITTTGPGVSQKISIVRTVPTGHKTGAFAWDEKNHITSILRYSNAGGSSTYRGVRLYHPTVDSWTSAGYTSATAYLFAASVVVGSETIHGSTVDSNGQPTGYTKDAVTLNDGWSLKSWANPTGALGNGLPVNPVARRIRSYVSHLPVKTVIAGANGGEDTYGPTSTDEYTDVPVSTLPTVNGSSAPIWSTGISLPTGLPIHRYGLVHRTLDRNVWLLETSDDHKTLDGASLQNLRGVGSADFGTTTFGAYSNGLPGTVTGTRGTYSAIETRTYLSGYPLLTQSIKTLKNGPTTIYANPANTLVQIGTAYQYDSSTFRWLTGEKDLADGRWTFYVPDGLGRVSQMTDKLQVVTSTAYDAWGRVSSVTRLAKGAVGQVKTEYFSDANGTWKEESTTGAGVTLTLRSDLDAAGRPTLESKYRGYGPGHGGTGTLIASRSTTYDGWGQKVSQSPWLKAGQSSYGNFTWEYDDLGRVTATHDRVGSAGLPAGRILNLVTLQPTYQTTTGGDGLSLTGVATSVKTFRSANQSFDRTDVVDLLGQKVGVIDQKGQTSIYTYDKDGHLISGQQGVGSAAQFRTYVYNDMGWLTSRTEPEEGSTTYSGFNSVGTPLLVTQTGRSGSLNNTVTTTLDSCLQPSQVTASGPEGTVTRFMTYDYGSSNTHALTGRSETQAITGLPSQTLTESYTYDDLARMKSKTVGDGSQTFTVSRGLDDLGNELSITYPTGGGLPLQSATITYDPQLRPATVSFAGTTRGTMNYDQLSGSSDTSTLTFGNNATSATKVDNGEVVQVTHSAAAGVLESNAVAWSYEGLMLSRGPSAGSGPDTFGYDELQRLVSAHVLNPSTGSFVDQAFSYDRFGNRSGVTTSAPTGSLPSPSEALSWTATYGPGSNDLPATVTGGSSLTTGAIYDQLGRLSQVWAIPGQSSSLTQWGYDPLGRVMKETVNGVLTAFLLDGEGLRFRRTKYDAPGGAAGTIDYTVYGFHREPLAFFERPLGVVHGGAKSLQIFHKTGTNSSLRRHLGTFQAGDAVTATVWVFAPTGTRAQVFLGNALSNGYTAFDNSKYVYVTGTGTWQQVTVSWTMSHADWMWVYVYGNTNSTGPDTLFTIYDDVAVSSVQRGTVMTDGFESGLAVATGNFDTAGWQSAGEPTDIDVTGVAGALEWRRSLVYGFGQLLSEDIYLQGTIYEQGDQVGSPNLVTDAYGTLKNRTKNLPFGERVQLPTVNQPKSARRFTNHEDQDGSAIYMQARTYLPAYGKFAQVDPAYDQTKDDPESWNLYNYVTNNPVTHTDPDGRFQVILDGLIIVNNNLDIGGAAKASEIDGQGRPVEQGNPVPTYLGSFIGPDGGSYDVWALPGNNGGKEGATPHTETQPQSEQASTGSDSPGQDNAASVKVILRLNLKFVDDSGHPLDESDAEKFRVGAEKTWTGTFGKYEVTAIFNDPNAKKVMVTVSADAGVSATRTLFSSKITLYAGGYQEKGGQVIQENDAQLIATFSHEVGHALGARDQYIGTGTPLLGHSRDIMGSVNPGNTPLESTIFEIWGN